MLEAVFLPCPSRFAFLTADVWTSSRNETGKLGTGNRGQTGSFPFSEVSSHYEPSESCETNIRKRPVCPRVPRVPKFSPSSPSSSASQAGRSTLEVKVGARRGLRSRSMKKRIVTLSVAIFAFAVGTNSQEIKSAPTLEVCSAQVNLWVAQMDILRPYGPEVRKAVNTLTSRDIENRERLITDCILRDVDE